MIITKKAAIGFILLAVIVFLTAQYTVDHGQAPQSPQVIGKNNITILEPVSTGAAPTMTYRPPLVNLGNNAPILITAIIEFYGLICYLGLKMLEPAINKDC